MVKSFRLEDFDFEVEIGKVANQANGAVWFKYGGTVVLVAATEAKSKEFPGFLPLTVDYREQYSAAGKIPGGYFKREGKSSDREVLIARLIDRSLRPLFPEKFFNQVQIVTNVYSVDKEHSPHIVALIAASLALTISDIPFIEPVGAVEMARHNGEWIVNPTHPISVESDVRIVVAGTRNGICMIEGYADELPEKEFIDVIFRAHEEIRKIVLWQEQIRTEAGKEKSSIDNLYNWDEWKEKTNLFLTDDRVLGAYIDDKVERKTYIDQLRETFIAEHAVTIAELEVPDSIIDYIFDSVLKVKLTKLVCQKKRRIDGRSYDTVRPVTTEVDVLPCTHGSALFTRGRTQALGSVTLGSAQDEQRLESIMDNELDQDGSFLLHYNFLPFCGGDVRPMRGPGRREIGHGNLAAKGFRFVRPSKEDFPYTIRVVVDILESDGSSSMATACVTTMALMSTGVPLKKMVAGIAMGLLEGEENEFVVLSDIAAIEDAFGLMDFKVVGTDKGITSIQMDVKYKGSLPREVFENAFTQAREGRLHILTKMSKVMDKPKENLSNLVPRVETIKIVPDKIGAVIGTGGKTIKEITEKTNTNIDIEQDGTVKIFGAPGADIDRALKWVKTLVGEVQSGERFDGKVRKIMDFGIFVELVPGQDGLVHISNIPREFQRSFAKKYRVDDIVTVEVLEADQRSGRISLKLIDEEGN